MDPGADLQPLMAARPFTLSPFRALRLPSRRVGDPGTSRQLNRGDRGVGTSAWRERMRAEQDTAAALYLHEYTSGGLTVRGLVGALDLSRRTSDLRDSVVLPHETIQQVQAEDLADRMQALSLNPAPILLVHRGSSHTREAMTRLRARAPDHSFDDRNGQHHRIWSVTDATEIVELSASLRSAQPLIADGHHRYGAYLRLQRRSPGGAADRGLVMLIDQTETPLFLGPIHRVLIGPTLSDVAAAAARTGHGFDVAAREVVLSRMGPATVALFDGQLWATLTVGGAASGVLPVIALHRDIIPELARGPLSVSYFHGADGALKLARRGRRIAALMPAPHVDEVTREAAHGNLLPLKATSFQPKPSTGVLIRRLTND